LNEEIIILRKEMPKLGLALGGGGARGLAHIGVLKTLEKEGVEISAITGCSMGAVVGGLYAFYGSATKVEDHMLKILQSPKFQELPFDELKKDENPTDKNYFEEIIDYIGMRLYAFKSLQNTSFLEEELAIEIFTSIPDEKIENLKIKFSAIATDLLSGEEINFTRGGLQKVLQASAAIPGIFPPVNIDKYHLVDGSASESVPVGKVKEIGADRVLAIDVTHNLKTIDKPVNIIDILYRAEDITSFHLSKERLREADLIISPKVKEFYWADFDKAEEIIAMGEEAVKESIEDIRKLGNRNSYILEIEQFIKKLKS